MAVSYQQVDPTDSLDYANCSGHGVASGSIYGWAAVGATAGTTPQTATIGPSGTGCIAACQIENLADIMTTGSWTVRLNITTGGSLTLTQVDLCLVDRINARLMGRIGTASASISLSTTGVKTVNVTSTGDVPPGLVLDYRGTSNDNGVADLSGSTTSTSAACRQTAFMHCAVVVIWSATNSSSMSNNSVSYTFDQLIDTPFTAATQFQQTDTAASTTNAPWGATSALTAGTFKCLTASVGGTAGTLTHSPSITVTNSAREFIAWVITPDSTMYWNPGVWVIPLDVVTSNATMKPTTLDIIHVDSSMNRIETLYSEANAFGTAGGFVGGCYDATSGFTTTGLRALSVPVPAPNSPVNGDKIVIIIAGTTSGSGTQSIGFKADQVIQSPYSSIAAGGERIPNVTNVRQAVGRAGLW